MTAPAPAPSVSSPPLILDSDGDKGDSRVHADAIKEVHSELRRKCGGGRRGGGSGGGRDDDNEETAIQRWKEHAEDTEARAEYARHMENLANKHWKQPEGATQKESRVRWVEATLRKFFKERDCVRIRRRARRRAGIKDEEETLDDLARRLRVLDVGSCYNPFGRDAAARRIMDVTPIDLGPASTDVYACDFLTAPVGDALVVDGSANAVLALPRDYYDAVIFCLLLEYLPIPQMRYDAVAKAADLLRDGGLLVIVTPDSSHQGKNLDVMRSWKICLSTLGMSRAYYDKSTHFHGVAFVKLDGKIFADFCHMEAEKEAEKLGRPLDNIDVRRELMVIPQDKEKSTR